MQAFWISAVSAVSAMRRTGLRADLQGKVWVCDNRPILRMTNNRRDDELARARAVSDLIESDRPLYLFVLSHHLIHQPVST
jgi:hypothetical protein